MEGPHVPSAISGGNNPQASLRIGEAARTIGVSPSALRLWERQDLVRPARTDAGYRLYSAQDLVRLRQVRRMREQHVNAQGIRRILGGNGRTDRREPAPRREPYPTGRRLRDLRRTRGLSLREASDRAGISPSFLSSVERDAVGASLATLQRLTRVYGVTVLSLFEPPPSSRRVVRRRHRRALELDHAGVRIEQLAETAEQLEPQLFTLGPGADSAGAYAHAGEEFLFVIDGELTLWLGERERYRLRAGDALTFPSTLPHRWRNRATGETRLLWINTPPTF